MTKRIAVVTGGMGGLGEAISVKLHDVGYTTIVTHSPTNPGVEAWLARMAAEGRRFQAYTVDVADYDSCQQCVEKIQGEIGPVDILINNAGITRDTSFKKLDKVNWDAVIRTNLDSVFNMTKPVCDGMVEWGWGRIINVSSIIGSKGGFGQTNYAAAKAGMHGFTQIAGAQSGEVGGDRQHHLTRLYRHQDGHGGAAGDSDTKIIPQIPVGRLGQPEEIAALVLYLRSREAAFVTGANIAINGGQHRQ
ncbi:SDR family NAD(P)-dependent oxidoreductase [Cupriavidus basilensis]